MGIINLSVGLPLSFEMYVYRDASFFAALARQTVIEMARSCVGAEIRSGPTQIVFGSIQGLDQSTVDF